MHRILVIESDAMVRGFLRAALESYHYGVIEAFNGAAGFEAAVISRPHAIVLDCLAPESGGVETLKRLRSDKRTSNIPVVAMSGLGQYGFDMGMWAQSWLIKPFRPIQMIDRIQGAIAATRATTENRPFIGKKAVESTSVTALEKAPQTFA